MARHLPGIKGEGKPRLFREVSINILLIHSYSKTGCKLASTVKMCVLVAVCLRSIILAVKIGRNPISSNDFCKSKVLRIRKSLLRGIRQAIKIRVRHWQDLMNGAVICSR